MTYFDRYLDGATTELDHNDEQGIRELLLGRRIVVADQDAGTLTLDDGTILRIAANYGCGGCTSGSYEIQSLETFDNVITSVEFEEAALEPKDVYADTVYRLFVYAGGISATAVTVAGTDGNGYYGTGYTVYVKPADTN
jgi:hypothetical protein